MTEIKKVRGRISINRTTGGEKGHYITLEIKDESSRCRIIEVEIDMDVFGPLVTGASEQPCEVQVYLGCPLGKVRELKTEYIPRPDCSYQNKKEVGKVVLAPYEVDDWIGYVADLFNNHKRQSGTLDDPNYGKQAVSFHRFVDPPAPEEQPWTTDSPN